MGSKAAGAASLCPGCDPAPSGTTGQLLCRRFTHQYCNVVQASGGARDSRGARGSTRAFLMPSSFRDPSLLLNINSGLQEVPTGYSQHPHGIRHPSISLISPWPAVGASGHAQALLLHGWVRSTARPTDVCPGAAESRAAGTRSHSHPWYVCSNSLSWAFWTATSSQLISASPFESPAALHPRLCSPSHSDGRKRTGCQAAW